MIRRNPCHNARLPKVYKSEIRPLSDEQVHDFLIEAEKDNIYGMLLRVILFTGLRESEALGSHLGLRKLRKRLADHQ